MTLVTLVRIAEGLRLEALFQGPEWRRLGSR